MNPFNLRLGVVLLVLCLTVASGCASGGGGAGAGSGPSLKKVGAGDAGTRREPHPKPAQVVERTPHVQPAAPKPTAGPGAVARRKPERARPAGVETGVASYYADKYHGRKTASGEVFDQRKMTAAHRTLPFGTRVRVTSVAEGKRSVVVRVNDRGPFVRGRVIDLSRAAADKLGMVRAGLAEVKVEVLDRPAAVARGG